MHTNILSHKQQELLPLVKQFSGDFGLVGGTAIALHLGHRRSIDFDLFRFKSFNIQNIRSTIMKKWKIEHTFIQGEGELTILVNQVKMTFFHFPYNLSFNEDFQGIIHIPDLLTLGAMKVFALGHRAKWKDYVDLYFLFHQCSLDELCKRAVNLFGTQFNEKLFRVQLGYFTDIDYTEEVEFMKGFEISQKEVYEYLENISLQK